ncbi:tetratricopeptide repeat protein [Tsuneonella sp. YG55]|uniref:Tetratricopeptide repeat protein n=1 Tax=Tsuneonella litorea TaxID=2976475 RepID=A0A9X2W0H0_9SPHN|nr:tetratricopeptide repeat protein [Tsuneonella litorea]MCT2557756.1 tetratricopeptide repeat protein [Tsuneonella litorea]
MLALVLPIMLMQVGIAPTSSPVTAVPPELQDRPPRDTVRNAAMPDRPASRAAIDLCLDTARTDPAKARSYAEEWVSRTGGLQRAAGRHCLGVAAGHQGDWAAAAAAFLAARDEAGDEAGFKARMGALAGSALLAGGRPAEALAALDAARSAAAGDADLSGAIALDRASALVALGRPDAAVAALDEARRLIPADAHAWLLSATLARRLGDLATAQQQIERAAAIDPRDPAIGLEAGVIAALGGRDDAARQSFASVVAAAPDSPQAAAARTYLAQIGG